MNALFYDEIEKLHQRQPVNAAELQRLLAMDYVGYIDRSLRGAGFRDPDLDPLVHDIVVKLITGALFRNVQGPFLARFATALKNSIITLATRRQRVRRRYSDHEIDTLPQQSAAPQPEDDVVERFREYVRQTLGDVALRVFDHRLDGGDTRDLRGQPGLESHYSLKEMVKRIKRAATAFARNDPDLLDQIERALASEQRTLVRRFAIAAASK
jgi:DNA-directed RNA polymerase specialized sigma24 family protein